MSAGRYALGLAQAAFICGSLGYCAWALRRRILPGWDGAPARLAELVLAVAVALALAEALGTAGLLRPLALIVGCAGLALAAVALERRPAAEPGAAPLRNAPAVVPWHAAVAGAAVTLVLAQWIGRALISVDAGMANVDTLWFHMTHAARFFQDASTVHVLYTTPGSIAPFYPSNFELIQALGMLPFHHEFLGPWLNLGALGILLLAGWCIGRPYGVAPATLTAVALVAAVPIVALTQPGQALSDLTAVAFYLAAIALLANGEGGGGVLGVAGLAAGLAVGTKVALIVPVLALTAAVAVVARRPRTPAMGWWALGVCAAGAYWYVRNLVAVGSPFPLVKLGIGPVALAHVHYTAGEHTILLSLSHYVTDPHAWSRTIEPGLAVDFTGLWFVVVGLAAAGIAVGLARPGRRAVRLLALVALASAAAYVFLPQSGYIFLYNVRAAVPPFALGLVLVPLVPVARRGDARSWVLALLVLVLLAVEVLFAARWHPGPVWPVLTGLGVALAAAALAGLALLLRRGRSRPTVAVATGIGLAALAAGGWFVQRSYVRHAYTSASGARGQLVHGTVPSVVRVYRRLRPLHDVRIGTVGFFENYPLYGRDLSNRVRYVARSGHLGALFDFADCRHWIAALVRGRYEYVVTAPEFFPYGTGATTPATAWTRAQPNVREELRDGPLSIFHVRGGLDPGACDRSGSARAPHAAALTSAPPRRGRRA